MVGVAPAGWAVAAGEGAAAVAGGQGAADGGGDQSGDAADVEGFADGAEHDRDEFGVTGQPAGDFDAERGAVVQGRGWAAGGALQRRQLDPDGDVGGFAAHLRVGGGGLLADAGERVGVALPGGAQVGDALGGGRGGRGERAEDGEGERAAFFVE